MDFSVILNYILGGGLLAALAGLLTLKATVRKANADAEKARAEAEKAKAEAEAVRLDNAEHATRILIENIVEPLKEELSETREELREVKKDLRANKRELARFRKAVESATGCKFRVDCPVLTKLFDHPKDNPEVRPVGRTQIRGQPSSEGEDDPDGGGTDVAGEAGDTDRQPP